ncbi:hypothetical protein UAJ10_09280 [Nitrospirillum sp. BR 11164]|uniref:hypothetical protein n=1 Tax=Nitrospirillum sp. BR 11164 TaxID=3104324 RepID=UPI002AFEB098|nr:hypothetical protein [Nitrospirillum sp. BR 11164]MEA1649209.1 hypothetical protein [Nitrospirillum sp. BR 11164]
MKLATIGRRPPNDPARTALAAAIKEANEADARLRAATTAASRAREALYAASAQVEEAANAIDQAKAEMTYRIVTAAAAGGDMPGGHSTGDRQRLAEAQDMRDAARAALTQLEAEEESARDAAQITARAVDRAATDILIAQMGPVAERALAAQRDWIRARRELAFLFNQCAWPWTDEQQRCRRIAEGYNNVDTKDEVDPAATWQAALDALKKDANTPLPAT